MARWINIVESNCKDPSRESEYNDWYDNIHMPNVLATPGFVSARRYEISSPKEGRGKYIAVYEIETNDLAETMKVRGQKRAEEGERGEMSDLIDSVSQVQFRLIGSFEAKS